MTSTVLYSAETVGHRTCGGCTLCCKLMPVAEIGKKGGIRCQHQKHTGCSIYHQPGMPHSCQIWSCRWLIDPETKDLSRPDRSRYVLDPVPDFVIAQTPQPDGSIKSESLPVMQVWVDPRYPDAHRDPALRAYLEATRTMALIRYGEGNVDGEGFVLCPPCLSSTHDWVEAEAKSSGREHTKSEIKRVLGQHGKVAVIER